MISPNGRRWSELRLAHVTTVPGPILGAGLLGLLASLAGWLWWRWQKSAVRT
jgi:hypothetical protein